MATTPPAIRRLVYTGIKCAVGTGKLIAVNPTRARETECAIVRLCRPGLVLMR